jgi:hypothetical protein
MHRCLFIPAVLVCMALGCLPDRQNGTAHLPRLSRLQNREAVEKLLPPDVRLDTVAKLNGTNKITVEQELIRVKARVGEDGTLQDAAGKPIQFVKEIGCWGNPPGGYLKILAEEERRLKELRKTHCVITLTCNPSGIPVP